MASIARAGMASTARAAMKSTARAGMTRGNCTCMDGKCPRALGQAPKSQNDDILIFEWADIGESRSISGCKVVQGIYTASAMYSSNTVRCDLLTPYKMRNASSQIQYKMSKLYLNLCNMYIIPPNPYTLCIFANTTLIKCRVYIRGISL